MDNAKLNTLNTADYNFIVSKDPIGNYDKSTRKNLYKVIETLKKNKTDLSSIEIRLYKKFRKARFGALGETEIKATREVRKYRLSTNTRNFFRIFLKTCFTIICLLVLGYNFLLDDYSKKRVQVALYAPLSDMGLVAKEEFEEMRSELIQTSTELKKAKTNLTEVNKVVEEMINNNKVMGNLKYIVKHIYSDSRKKYLKKRDTMRLMFDGKEIASFNNVDASRWYLVGIIEKGVFRVYYDDDEILEIDTIFGRKGEETPIGEYEIKNRVFKPTWYKKEIVKGKKKIRAIAFGDPDHEIGHWWMGLRKLGEQVPGSYGLHGVNASKVNEFYRKNFDWRSGSAGCPNIQAWFLEFLAKVLPMKTRVNIVEKDKWNRL